MADAKKIRINYKALIKGPDGKHYTKGSYYYVNALNSVHAIRAADERLPGIKKKVIKKLEEGHELVGIELSFA
jgi:hypothetical protein